MFVQDWTSKTTTCEGLPKNELMKRWFVECSTAGESTITRGLFFVLDRTFVLERFAGTIFNDFGIRVLFLDLVGGPAL